MNVRGVSCCLDPAIWRSCQTSVDQGIKMVLPANGSMQCQKVDLLLLVVLLAAHRIDQTQPNLRHC